MRTLSIRPHNSSDYAGLLHIDKYKTLSEREEACLMALGKVLCDRGVNKRLGVARLHHHFPVFDNELMVERLFPEKGEQVVSPEPSDYNDNNTILPTVFMFEALGVGEQGLVALEYAASSTVSELSLVEKNALVEVGAVIKAMGCEKRLGICIRHGDLQGEQEIALLEDTDESERRNVSRLVPLMGIDPTRTTETRWFFEVPDGYGSMSCSVQPTRICRSWCQANWGSGTHSKGHDTQSGYVHR